MLAVLSSVCGACGTHATAPKELLDGKPAVGPKVELEGIRAAGVLTTVTVANAGELAPGSLAASCLAGPARGADPRGRVVERIGVVGETVTFEERSAVLGCDNTSGAREGDRRWCGGSFGRLYGGHLRDPRVDIAGCRTKDGDPVAFAWVEPGRDARYVVVDQPGYAEVYEVVPDEPVRISTTQGIESDPLGATFEVSEHGDTGNLLRRYRVEARPAG